MTRREAREQALCLVFERMFHEEPMDEIVELARESREMEPDPFALQLAEGVGGHGEELNAAIEQYAIGWSRERLSKVTLAILQMSIYEIRYIAATPVSVAINEAVELAKKFGGDGDSAFVNGILGSVARGGETAGDPGSVNAQTRGKAGGRRTVKNAGGAGKAAAKKAGGQAPGKAARPAEKRRPAAKAPNKVGGRGAEAPGEEQGGAPAAKASGQKPEKAQ